MSGSLNKVSILGTLGKDPESRSFNNGGKVVNLSVATSESWKDKGSGERKEKTEWHKVSIFSEGIANVAEKYLRKGSKVYLEGKLQTRKWQDQSGADRYSTEIVLQGYDAKLLLIGDKAGGSGGGGGGRQDDGWGGEDNRGRSGSSGGGGNFNGGGQRSGGGGFADDLDDDVPFITSDFRYEGRAS